MSLDAMATNMADEAAAPTRTKCLNCGFETAAESDRWLSVEYSPLGTLTQCPECESTNIISRGTGL